MNQKTNPLVSVVIPSYNHGAFIGQRIDTVLAQTYQNIEVFILDDCSTDNSREVIAAYKDSPKVAKIVLNETNTGNTFVQWERGISMAQGEYVWIAESDDYTDPTFLKKIIRKLTAHPDAVLGFCHSVCIDQFGDELPMNLDVSSLYSHDGVYDGVAFGIERMMRANRLYNASMIVFRRECFFQVDPLYKELRRSGDWAFWSCICAMGQIVEVPERLNYFRQHSNKVSFSGSQEEGLIEMIRIVLQNLSLFKPTAFQQRIIRYYIHKNLTYPTYDLVSFKKREALKLKYPKLLGYRKSDKLCYKLDKLLFHFAGVR